MSYSNVIQFIRNLYPNHKEHIPLHSPFFHGNEKKYLVDCIDSTFVSTIGHYVTELEGMLCRLTGARHAVATVNGTCALHAALIAAGVEPGDEVITQGLSFVATANAVAYCNAVPVFTDVDLDTLGLSPGLLMDFLESKTEQRGKYCYNMGTGRKIAACVPMHTFGHPARVDEIVAICSSHGVPVVEDAAEALGSSYHGKSCGTFGLAGVYSFNGNKIVTAGGGGAIVTDDDDFAKQVRHLTTTAKKQHDYVFDYTEVGFNYRMPNVNAALCCAQLEQLDSFVIKKRNIAKAYRHFFQESGMQYFSEPPGARSNYWLNAVLVDNLQQRDAFLQATNQSGILTRPAWTPLYNLPMYDKCEVIENRHVEELARRVVNLPSGVPS